MSHFTLRTLLLSSLLLVILKTQGAQPPTDLSSFETNSFASLAKVVPKSAAAWSKNSPNSISLMGTSLPVGVPCDIWIGNVLYPNILSFYLDSYSQSQMQLFLLTKEPQTGKVFAIEITQTGGIVMESNLFGVYSEYGFRVVSRNGSVSPIQIRQILSGESIGGIVYTLDNTFAWYDMDGDGVKERILPSYSDGKSFTAIAKVVESGFMIVEKREIGIQEAISVCNLTNDDVPDFFSFNRGGNGDVVVQRNYPGGVFRIDTIHNTVSNKIADFAICDYNADGYPDILKSNDEVYLQTRDSSFIHYQLSVMTPREFTNQVSSGDWVSNGSGGLIVSDGIPSLRDGLFTKQMAYVPQILETSDIDFNHDGRPDLVNGASGKLLLNVGGNNYVSHALGGSLFFRDLNNDERLDYVVYDGTLKSVSACVEQADGTVREQKLISNLSLDSQLWCYDFDKDGDVDILLPFSYQASNEASFLVVMENDGNGKFKMHENYYDQQLTMIDCVDMDGDGYYDVVATDNNGHTCLLKGDSRRSFTLQAEPLIRDYQAQVVLDLDGDGRYEVVAKSKSKYSQKPFYFKDYPVSRVPEQMQAPDCLYDAQSEMLKISWEQGKGGQTSPVDFTYALRIGTAPGRGDVLYAHADANGMRLNLQGGNQGYNLDKVMNTAGWAAGDYYLSVQAINPMRQGGAWSKETVFRKKSISAVFDLAPKATLCDSVFVSLQAKPDPALTYTWATDGGEWVSTDAVKGIYRIHFKSTGTKTIVLTVADKSNNRSSRSEKKIEISSSSLEKKPLFTDYHSAQSAFDMNNDGLLELASSNGMYESDGKGNYSKIKRIYNTNLDAGISYYADINRNGVADLIALLSNKRTVCFYENSNDKTLTELFSFSQSDPGFGEVPVNLYTMFSDVYLYFDVNNDGYTDMIGEYDVLLNQGDYKTYKRKQHNMQLYRRKENLVLYDFDRDGYLDIVDESSIGSHSNFSLLCHMNNGDGSFRTLQLPTGIRSDEEYFQTTVRLADMNGDGYKDLVGIKNGSTLFVAINNQGNDFNEIKEIRLEREYYDLKIAGLLDLDNNGYNDLQLGYAIPNSWGNASTYERKTFLIQMSKDFGYRQGSDTPIRVFANVLDPFGFDINGDGIPDLSDGSYQFINRTQNITNTQPSAPTSLRAIQGDTHLSVCWDASIDKETPLPGMRYNLSVKKANAEGEGAFVVSPMNGLSNEAALSSSFNYIDATTYSIPLSVLPVGKYEIQIQSLDGWKAHSSFSAPILVEITANPQLLLPKEAYAGMDVGITYKGYGNPSWDWNGGTVSRVDDKLYTVKWDSPGMKTISVTTDGVTYSTSLLVAEKPSAEFVMQSATLKERAITIGLPQSEIPMSWNVSYNQSDFVPLEDQTNVTMTEEGSVVFNASGTYVLQLKLTTSCGIISSEKGILVEELPAPEIELVTIDNATGKNKLTWKLSSRLPTNVDGINIYKEGSTYNSYTLLETIPLNAESYVDLGSDSEARSSRYCIAWQTSYNQESDRSIAHQNAHLMINKGSGNSFNLIWSPYEGATINSYRILRGTSPENLTPIAEVSGHHSSYTDFDVPSETFFYALEYELQNNPIESRSRNEKLAVRSNIVSTVGAPTPFFAGTIRISTVEGVVELSNEQPTLHLTAEVFPMKATYRKVGWLIVSGEELATVDQNGLLSATTSPGGNIVVRAIALDGSGTASEITIDKQQASNIEIAESDAEQSSIVVYPSPASEWFAIHGLPDGSDNTEVTLFNIHGVPILNRETSETSLIINCSSLEKGIYVIQIRNEGRVFKKRLLKR